eukprot:TRINITY_DN4143_c0_g5_i1.p3 TRINITY_DN4143_c0_g5~~TRINITY_DN4143_c0_g5_i1.p3  ORF type:complete len:105 (-),score=9.47 TRINITY_DN4143_c0_g5_i1:804-1118(-)
MRASGRTTCKKEAVRSHTNTKESTIMPTVANTTESGRKTRKKEKVLKGQRVGMLALTNGERYNGSWIGDCKSGEGTQYWSDGTKYEGEWRNGKKDGKGEAACLE